jgi:hypothetical protein
MSTFFRALEQAEQDRERRRPAVRSASANERSLVFSAESRKGLEQLKLLFAYTKFDIGLYAIVATLFAAAIAFEPAVFRIHKGFLSLAVVFIYLAGPAAGIIASHCEHLQSWNELWEARIGPFGWRCLKGEYWAYVQHACFGIALVTAVLSVLGGYATWPPFVLCTP